MHAEILSFEHVQGRIVSDTPWVQKRQDPNAAGRMQVRARIKLPVLELSDALREASIRGGSAERSWGRLNRSLEILTYPVQDDKLPLFIYGPLMSKDSSLSMVIEDYTVYDYGSTLPGYFLKGGATEESTELVTAAGADLSGVLVMPAKGDVSELDAAMDALGDYARVLCVLSGGELAYTYAGPDTLSLCVKEFCPVEGY